MATENGDQREEEESFIAGSLHGYDSLHQLLQAYLKPEIFQEVSRLLLRLNCGRAVEPLVLLDSAIALSLKLDFDMQEHVLSYIISNGSLAWTVEDSKTFWRVKGFLLPCRRRVVARTSNSLSWSHPKFYCSSDNSTVSGPKEGYNGESETYDRCCQCFRCQYFMLQEAWMMPFVFCTREKRWCEFAEPVDGESTQVLQDLARNYNMVIVSPILERDVNHGETLWNTAVIIGNNGNIIGKHRKARNAAIANSYFVGSINRVGTEVFPNPFTSGDGRPQHTDFGHFYGSSCFSAPDASCTPSLSHYRDGLIIAEMDLNLCRQLKDKWGLCMTSHYDIYSELLSRYLEPSFQPQVISDPHLQRKPP